VHRRNGGRSDGFDHRIGHVWPLSMTAESLHGPVISPYRHSLSNRAGLVAVYRTVC
jgi:hypothetical protein